MRTLSIVPLAHHCGSKLWDIMPCQNNYLRSPLYLFASRVHCPLSISLGTKIAKETQRKPKLLYKTFLALLLCFTEWEMFFVLFLGFVNSLFCSASNIWTTLFAAFIIKVAHSMLGTVTAVSIFIRWVNLFDCLYMDWLAPLVAQLWDFAEVSTEASVEKKIQSDFR